MQQVSGSILSLADNLERNFDIYCADGLEEEEEIHLAVMQQGKGDMQQ